jgi:AraC-like DNA-binding protein
MRFARALLECRPQFRSRDVDQTRAFFAGFGVRFEPIGSNWGLDVRLNGASLPGFYTVYVQSGAAALRGVGPETQRGYVVVLSMRGRLEAASRQEAVGCDARQGVVLSPTPEYIVRSEGGAARLGIQLQRDAVAQHLAALLGTAPDAPLIFVPLLDLRQGHGRSLARFVRLAIAELKRPDTVLLEPNTARSFGEFMTTALLLHQPHNYSDRLRRLERPVAPRDVKRAIDYIEGNLDTAIGLPEIVAACGVPGRTLVKHFRDFRGTPPMRYLRTARYEKAREELTRAEPEESVAEIAARWGFTHMGRFSVDYRRRFGEAPSATLRRGRNGRPDR